MVDPLDYWQGGLPENLGLFGSDDDSKDKENAYAARKAENYQKDNPYWQGAGRENDAKTWAYDTFMKVLGRAPTESEMAQALPVFLGGDPNITDVAAGTAFVSAIANSPENVYKRQQEQYMKDAPGKYGEVGDQIRNMLGREASQEELDHFGKLMASGQADQYQLQEFLKAQPEYMSKQDASFREGLGNELQAGDARYFNEQIMPGIQSQFAKQGRTVDATGFQNALGREATGQNRQREQFLANLSAQQYGGRQAGARADYESYYNNLQNRQNASLTSQVGRQNELADYSMQQAAYGEYLKKYGKRGSPLMGGLSGAMSGASAGAMTGNPWAALAGGVIGGGLGAYGASQY